jgi:hypothetical protein
MHGREALREMIDSGVCDYTMLILVIFSVEAGVPGVDLLKIGH